MLRSAAPAGCANNPSASKQARHLRRRQGSLAQFALFLAGSIPANAGVPRDCCLARYEPVLKNIITNRSVILGSQVALNRCTMREPSPELDSPVAENLETAADTLERRKTEFGDSRSVNDDIATHVFELGQFECVNEAADVKRGANRLDLGESFQAANSNRACHLP